MYCYFSLFSQRNYMNGLQREENKENRWGYVEGYKYDPTWKNIELECESSCCHSMTSHLVLFSSENRMCFFILVLTNCCNSLQHI